MKKLIYVVIVLILSFFVYTVIVDNIKSNEQDRIKELALETQRNKIDSEVRKYGANIEWREVIKNKYHRKSTKILTNELQELWISNHPIAFPGGISDIEILSDSTVIVKIVNNNFDLILSTKLELELTCSKQLVDDFLSSNKDLLENFGFNNNIIAIGKILKVKTYNSIDGDSVVTRRIGVGTCVSLIRGISLKNTIGR